VPETLGATVGARLSELAGLMRESGARVGVGELLAAHRALAAVDPASREDAYYALRAALCSTRAELAIFADAFAVVFAAPEGAQEDPLAALGEIERAAMPRVGVPQQAPGTEPRDTGDPVPAAWSEEELLREKDFAAYTDAERAVARRLLQRIALRGPSARSRGGCWRGSPPARRSA
jgi:uncharacterized protein